MSLMSLVSLMSLMRHMRASFALLLLDQVVTSELLPSLEAARRSHPDRVGVVQIAPTSEMRSEGVQGWILRIMPVWTPSQNWM